jgi:hypothetical protein
MRLRTSAEPASYSGGVCEDIPFVDRLCGAVDAATEAFDFASDPLGYIARLFHEAVERLFTEMVNALLATTTIDWSDPGFLRTYGMAFAASSVLTVVLWLIAAGKRAVQGVPPMQAVAESIGYLLMAVAVSALAPAIVAYATQLFDLAAEAMFAPVADDAPRVVVTVTAAMGALSSIPGGPIIVSFLAVGLLAAVAGVWMELIIRDALILSGLVFGTSVFSGLVDRNLWGHAKRWIGVMGAVIVSKYVTLTTLALATGLLASDGGGERSVAQSFATVFTAIALLWLALYLPFQLAKFLPLVGDEIQGMYQARDDFQGRAGEVGSHAGDTFQELKGRFGGGGGEASGGGPAAAEAGAGEAAASSTGVGAVAVAGEKVVDTAKEQAERTAERSVETATGESGEGAEDPDAAAEARGGPDPSIPPSSPDPSTPLPAPPPPSSGDTVESEPPPGPEPEARGDHPIEPSMPPNDRDQE